MSPYHSAQMRCQVFDVWVYELHAVNRYIEVKLDVVYFQWYVSTLLGQNTNFQSSFEPNPGGCSSDKLKISPPCSTFTNHFCQNHSTLFFFTSSGDSIREPGTFPGTLKISESREGDYKVSAAEVKWPPTNDLIYKFWNSAKGPFLCPPKACIKKLCGPDLIKIFSVSIYSTLEFEQSYCLRMVT